MLPVYLAQHGKDERLPIHEPGFSWGRLHLSFGTRECLFQQTGLVFASGLKKQKHVESVVIFC